MLVQLRVQQIPNMKPNDAKAEFEKIVKLAYPKDKANGKKLSNKELAEILSRR